MYSHRQASQQCRFSKVEQDYDSVLGRQRNTSPGLYLFPEEEKEKQLRQYEVIRSDEPPKPKGKRPPGAKKRIRQQDKAFLHSASGYSPTDDLHSVQQESYPYHMFRVPLNEPHLPSQLSAGPLSVLGYNSTHEPYSALQRSQPERILPPSEPHFRSQISDLFDCHQEPIQGHSMSGFSTNSMSAQQQFQHFNNPYTFGSVSPFEDPIPHYYSRFHESGNSRSHESGNSRSRESGNSRSRESGNSRSHESGTSKAIIHEAAMEAPHVVEALVKSIQSSYKKGQLDMTEGREQLLSSGENLLCAAAVAYCRSESSPEVIRKILLALEKYSLAYWLPPQIKPLANIISFHEVKRIIEILKCMFDGEIGSVEACKQILDIVGSSVCGCSIGLVGAAVGAAVGTAVGGPGGALAGESVGAWAGEKIGKSLWELIKEAIGCTISFIRCLLK